MGSFSMMKLGGGSIILRMFFSSRDLSGLEACQNRRYSNTLEENLLQSAENLKS